METADRSSPMEIFRGDVRLPPFSAEDQPKLCYVISHLDHQYATEVKDIITSPPE
jgi:hypothetical protein